MSGEPVLHLVSRIQNDFLEMSDLRVTLKEARQLWNMDKLTSEQILEALVACKFLSRTWDGAFIRDLEVADQQVEHAPSSETLDVSKRTKVCRRR